MTDQPAARVGWVFYAIAIFALISNGMGAMNFVMQMMTPTRAEGSPFPENHRMIIENRPIWATAGFGIAVFGGAIASLLMLLRRKLAVPVFYLSLGAVFLPSIYTAALLSGPLTLSATEVVMIIILPIVVAGLMSGYARNLRDRDILR